MSNTQKRGQIRVGLIGAGLIGQAHSMMLRRIADRTDNGIRVVAIADRDAGAAEKLASRWPGARALNSADEVTCDNSIDAVWICTPTAHHREACIAAARAGKHIFCEKPLAMSTARSMQVASPTCSAGSQSTSPARRNFWLRARVGGRSYLL